MSVLGLGCNNFGSRLDLDQSREVVHAALEAGVRHFDTADVYGGGASEEFLGHALQSVNDDVVVATKFGIIRGQETGGGRPAYVRSACEASLSRLRRDHIDVFYFHKPDPGTSLDDTIGALDDLVAQGKIRQFAWSNQPAWQLVDNWHRNRAAGRRQLAMVQLGWNLLDTSAETELIPACRHLHTPMVVFSPLASGLLTGKYPQNGVYPEGSRLRTMPQFSDVATTENLRRASEFAKIAADHGLRPAALALSWLAGRPGVQSVLTGATSAGQIRANAADVAHRLDAVTLADIDAIRIS
ncbi:aldo/keto reductase [Mycolicibacterium murale]|nr:aldo/keto reductase [Mycolicibacterium murale]MCV7180330.1 aldo/keto reductase [Mycolicibacterium murale]